MLDFNTVFFYSACITLFVATATGIAWYRSKEGSETRFWFLASIFQVFGSAVMSMGAILPLYIAGYVGGVLTIAATGYLRVGYKQLYGAPYKLAEALSVALIFGTGVFLTKLLSHGVQDGVFLIYLGAAVNLGMTAAFVWKASKSEPLSSARLTMFIITAYALANLASAPFAFFWPTHFVNGYPDAEWLKNTTIPLVLLNLATYMMTLIVKLERSIEQQRVLATHDALTGVLNRGAFFERANACRANLGVLAIVDLDHFKSINDTHGHIAGDGVLKHVTRAIEVRLPEGSFLGRLGGEEFGICMPETNEEIAHALLETLRQTVEAARMRSVSGREFSVTMSCGYARVEEGSWSSDQVFAAADFALYAAKNSGRNRVMAYDPVYMLRQQSEIAASKAPNHMAALAGSA